MDLESSLAIVAFGIGALVTPVYLVLIVKVVHLLAGIRKVLTTPPGEHSAHPQR